MKDEILSQGTCPQRQSSLWADDQLVAEASSEDDPARPPVVNPKDEPLPVSRVNRNGAKGRENGPYGPPSTVSASSGGLGEPLGYILMVVFSLPLSPHSQWTDGPSRGSQRLQRSAPSAHDPAYGDAQAVGVPASTIVGEQLPSGWPGQATMPGSMGCVWHNPRATRRKVIGPSG